MNFNETMWKQKGRENGQKKLKDLNLLTFLPKKPTIYDPTVEPTLESLAQLFPIAPKFRKVSSSLSAGLSTTSTSTSLSETDLTSSPENLEYNKNKYKSYLSLENKEERYAETAKLLNYLHRNPHTEIKINWNKIPQEETDYYQLAYRVLPKLPKIYLERLYDIDIKLLGYILFSVRNHGLQTETPPLEKQLLPSLKWKGDGWWNCAAVSVDYMAKLFKRSQKALLRNMHDLHKMGMFSKRKTRKTIIKTAKGGAGLKFNPNIYFLQYPLLYALVCTYYAKYPEAFSFTERTKEEKQAFIAERKKEVNKAIEANRNNHIRSQKMEFPYTDQLGDYRPGRLVDKYGVANWINYTEPQQKYFMVRAMQKTVKNYESFMSRSDNEIYLKDQLLICELAKERRLSASIYNNRFGNNWNKMPKPAKNGRRFTFANVAKSLVNNRPFNYSCKKFASRSTQKEVTERIVSLLEPAKLNINNKKLESKLRRAEQYIYGCFQDFIPRNSKSQSEVPVTDNSFLTLTKQIVNHVFRSNLSDKSFSIKSFITEKYPIIVPNIFSNKNKKKEVPLEGLPSLFITKEEEKIVKENQIMRDWDYDPYLALQRNNSSSVNSLNSGESIKERLARAKEIQRLLQEKEKNL